MGFDRRPYDNEKEFRERLQSDNAGKEFEHTAGLELSELKEWGE